MQSAQGGFTVSPLLQKSTLNNLPWDLKKHSAQITPLAKGSDQALWTAITLIAFATCFPSDKALWQRAARKAIRWLSANNFTELAAVVLQATGLT